LAGANPEARFKTTYRTIQEKPMSPNNPLAALHAQVQALTSALNGMHSRLSGVESGGGLGALHGGEPRSDIGPISGYLQDVYNLAPEVVRVEHMRFDLRIVNQIITFQSEAKRIDPEFAFALRRLRIVGWCSDEANLNFASPDVTFNIEDQGRGRGGVFLDPISIVETANHNGTFAGELVWDSFYRFVAAASIRGLWTVDLSLMPANETVVFTASIEGDLLRTRTLPGGAMVTNPSGTPR
jgi:hypothetical protein